MNSSIFNKVLSNIVKSCHHSTSSTFLRLLYTSGGFVAWWFCWELATKQQKLCTSQVSCQLPSWACCTVIPASFSMGPSTTENPWILGSWILDFRSSTLNIHKLFAITKGLMNSTTHHHSLSFYIQCISSVFHESLGEESTSVINSESSCPKHLSSTLIFGPTPPNPLNQQLQCCACSHSPRSQ